MKWIRKILISGLIIFASMFLMNNIASAKSAEHYTIGVGPTFVPFEIQNKQGSYNTKHPGLDVEILRAIAKKENFTYTFKIMNFAGAVQALEGNQVDGVIAAMMATPERAEKIDFSKPYYNVGLALAVPKNSDVKSYKDLKGKVVAVKTGSTSEQYAESVQKKYGFRVQRFNDSNTELSNVLVGNSDAAIDSTATLLYSIKNHMNLKLVGAAKNKNPVAFGVKKGQNAELLKRFNAGLAAIKKDGTYAKIVHFYTGEKSKSAIPVESKSDRTYFGLLKSNSTSFINGIKMTLEITVVAIFFATIIGIILGVLGSLPSKLLRGISSTYAFVFKSIPVMVLAFFVYIGIPNLTGEKIPLFIAGVITIVMENSAYTASFVRGGIEAVDSGQMEAAQSNGMSYWQAMRYIVLPQALRIMAPSFINQFIIALKGTSVLSAIGVAELTQQGTIIISRNMEGFKVWLLVSLMYLAMIGLLSYLSNLVKKHYQLDK
ncbi:glutamine ABC transporter substrate-binding protein [Lentilactobacillus diolivorans]|uniref:Glutamine ABC transporter substrate-binding protein n=1 Tax=Lentilactobacillus diolivorans TaxID=179838 RepID=A0ABQ0XCU0_9LACO|nr:glutamine ABC transporter substrate-binding protein [Lentilactobacillus diolivorans]